MLAADIDLTQSVNVLPGVGSERLQQLARLKITTVEDLLLHRPRRYEDRRRFLPIREIQIDEPATVCGKIVVAGIKSSARSGKSTFEMVLDDGTARLHCRWWNMPFLERMFRVGEEWLVYGKTQSLKPRTFEHPETEPVLTTEEVPIHLNRIVPVYPLTEGLSQRVLRSLLWRTLDLLIPQLREPHGSDPKLSPALLAKSDPARSLAANHLPLVPQPEAISRLHFPAEMVEAEDARQRLGFDEFLELQISLRQRRLALESQSKPHPCPGDNRWIRPLLQKLPHSLTRAQARVLREIRNDLGSPTPMRRLLQGDVGSGKTIVATCAALMALESGFDVALMAPTEILAEQLFSRLTAYFDSLPHPPGLALQTGSQHRLPKSDTPAPCLTVGTHALLETRYQPSRLGLVIIDEQHKFGVRQREALLKKGQYPHLLVMTATPIPRTLGLTWYGDLDVSVIDELPPGRRPIRTHLRETSALPKVWEFIRRELDAGHQAYLVYPRITEVDEPGAIKAVTSEFQKISKTLAPHRVGLLHGQLSTTEKESTMNEFRSGITKALVATSVIEVGVDVPNASVMLVENAGQFGLAALHQLRGRIGRGSNDSHCILVDDFRTPESRQRLEIMRTTHDGFALAEADMELRGPGDFLGKNQSGMPKLRFGDLNQDRALLELARALAPRFC